MELKLNIYNDCTSEKPSKTYVIRRILLKTAKELDSINQEAKEEKGDDWDHILKLLKCVIPDFQDEDIDGVDPAEFGNFMKQIGGEIHNIMDNAQKN